jgi:hypothetical protein
VNLLKHAHSHIKAKFYARIWASLLFYGGYAVLFYADWRVGLGLFLILTGIATDRNTQ